MDNSTVLNIKKKLRKCMDIGHLFRIVTINVKEDVIKQLQYSFVLYSAIVIQYR